jgi:hypothetical protein
MNPTNCDFLQDLLSFGRYLDLCCNPPPFQEREQQDINGSFPGATR